jgi:hypothetical protein
MAMIIHDNGTYWSDEGTGGICWHKIPQSAVSYNLAVSRPTPAQESRFWADLAAAQDQDRANADIAPHDPADPFAAILAMSTDDKPYTMAVWATPVGVAIRAFQSFDLAALESIRY